MKSTNRFLIVYYIILLFVFASRQGDTAPSIAVRLAFMAAAILPAVITKGISYPAVITLFSTLTLYGFSYSYMPYTLSLYVLVTLVLTVFLKTKDKQRNKVPLLLFLFPVYVFFIDFISGAEQSKMGLFEESFFCFVMLLCFYYIAMADRETSIKQLSLIFMVVSVVFSLYFILNRETFAVNYDYNGQYERIGWIDPNYFGTVLGMGVVIAFCRFFERVNGKRKNIESILGITTVILTIPVMLLNASRGALLSVVVAGVVLFMFAKAKKWHKFALVIIAVMALVYLYNNQYMDLLAYRIENDETGGSGRLPIWSSKLAAFSGGNVFSIIFGCGYDGGLNISGHFIGFHNDYIAFLVDYGIVGLIMFIYMLSYPLLRVRRYSSSFPFVISIIVYIAVTCFTLEPLTGGRLTYFSFYLIALLSSIPSTYSGTNAIKKTKI